MDKNDSNIKPKSATLNPIRHHEEKRPKTTNISFGIENANQREKTLTKITLSLDEPNRPDLLERYWKYNKVKRQDVLKNRYLDEIELNSIYLTCSKYYVSNFRKLIRHNQNRDKSRDSLLKSRATLPTVLSTHCSDLEKSQIICGEKRAKSVLKKTNFNISNSLKKSQVQQDDLNSNEKRRFMLSISDFNKFKNRFKDDSLYIKRKSIDDLNEIDNIHSYSTNEIKRLKYLNAIQQRQIFLSESINVKKLEI